MAIKRSSSAPLIRGSRVMGGIVLVLMLIVWEHVEALHLQRQIKGMAKEEDQLIFQNAHLQSQINQWISPSHLDSVARKSLGMIPLDSQHRIGVDLP
jgi:cell division protein FtsL